MPIKTRPAGLEPTTYRFEVCHSIQLSYGRIGANIGQQYKQSYIASQSYSVFLEEGCLNEAAQADEAI